MNKIIIFISFIVSVISVNLGISAKVQVEGLKEEELNLQIANSDIEMKIKDKELLVKHEPILLLNAYELVINQVRTLEVYSGTNINVQLEANKDTEDISNHYINTEYRGIKGLKVKIVVDKFTKETDMGAILEDIHLLEKNTDFMASEISKDSNNLIVKGEIYGI